MMNLRILSRLAFFSSIFFYSSSLSCSVDFLTRGSSFVSSLTFTSLTWMTWMSPVSSKGGSSGVFSRRGSVFSWSNGVGDLGCSCFRVRVFSVLRTLENSRASCWDLW